MHRDISIDEAPAPGEPLREKIAIENQRLIDEELQERIERSRAKLSFWQLWRAKRRYRQLFNFLNKANYNNLVQSRWVRLEELRSLKRELETTKNKGKRERLIKEIREAKTAGRKLHERIQSLQTRVDEFTALGQRLQAHRAVVQWERKDREDRKEFRREAQTWESQIKAVFLQSARLHYRGERNGKPFTQIPVIERILFKEDRVLFKIKTTAQTILERILGRWHSALPYNVDINALTCEETLTNLSAACRRIVNVEYSNSRTQIFYSISRLDAADGIPKRFLYQKILDWYPVKDHSKTVWAAGVTMDRKIEWFTFEDHPNILVAGSPGGGKSNHLNQMIATLASMNKPSEVQMLMIDLKGGIEFVHWQELKHLVSKIVKTPEGVREMLQNVRGVMERRLGLFEQARAKKLSDYNKKAKQPLPRLIIFVDEMATLVGLGDLTTDIHNELRVISSQGRAAGVHLVLATQHPSVDVLPGWVKTNMNMRIASKMPSHTASQIILDTISAALLPVVSGRMVFSVGRMEIVAQSPYISDDEIARAVALSQQFPAAEINEFASDNPPPPAPREKFTREKLIELAITEYGGKLTPVRMHNRLTNDVISRRNLQKMIDEIVDSGGGVGGSIWFNGAEYRIGKDRKTYTLVQIAQDKDIEDTDNFSAIDELLEQEVTT